MDTTTQGIDTLFRILVGINALTLLAVVSFGYRVMRFINLLEFKVDLMWQDYEARTDTAHAHRRDGDR